MRYRALDANLLVMLELIIDNVSITKTAEILGLTQPAVSAALGRLREHFSDELMVQVGRTNVLTPLAERLRDPLKDVLQRMDSLISQRVGFDPTSDRRHFSFIGSDYVASTFGNLIVREIALAGTHLSAQLEHLGLDSLDRFERAQIDAFVGPRAVMTPDHLMTRLFEERFVCVVWNEHPEIGDHIDLEQFLRARNVVNSFPGRKLVGVAEAFLAKQGIERRVAVQVSSFADMVEVVPGTPFVAVVQSRMAKWLPIRVLAAPLDFPALEVFIQWHGHHSEDEGSRWFRARIADVVSRLDD